MVLLRPLSEPSSNPASTSWQVRPPHSSSLSCSGRSAKSNSHAGVCSTYLFNDSSSLCLTGLATFLSAASIDFRWKLQCFQKTCRNTNEINEFIILSAAHWGIKVIFQAFETESHDLFTLMFRSCPDNWQLSAASYPFIRHWCNQRAAEHSNRLRTDFPDFSFLSALQRCLGAFTGIWSSLWEDELGPQRTSFATHIRHELQNKPATGSDFSSHMDAISSDAWWEGCFQFLQPNSDWSKESSHTGSDETQLCLVA